MKKILIILFLFLPVFIFPGNWYLSTTSSGNASGNSWANKRILSNFNWSQVQPGDVVYLDGGTDSLVYNINNYDINTHGTTSLPITITKGVDASHNGKVVFLNTGSSIGLSLGDISNTIIQYIKIKGGLSNVGETWLLDFNGNCQNVTFQYCEFEQNWSCGISCESSSTSNNIKFLHNNFYNWLDTGTNSSMDMMWMGGIDNTNWEIAYNNIINKNPKTGATPSSAHRDLIQFSWGFGGAGGTTKIHHNFFDDRSAGAAGACIEAYDVGGNWEIYNNIWKSNSTGANGSGDFSLISMSIPRSAGAVWGIRTWFSSMKMYNNTFYATTSHVSPLFLIGFSSVDVRNNIFYAPSLGAGSVYLATDLYTQNHSMTWDYNQYYNNSHSNIMVGYGDTGVGIADGASTYTWTQWRAAGYDLHSTYNTNTPTFISSSGTNGTNYALQSGSEGINDGTTIPFVTDDYSGIARPQGSAYDLGAFEYSESSGGDTTPPNLQGAVLNSSTILILNFSESLNTTTAQNKNNYSINNGVSVSSAVLSGTQVTLTTSVHVSGAYTVSVSNVTDLAGNVINPNNNTASYNYSPGDVTPPQVLSAALIDSVSLNVFFSENLESGTAQNISNYTINGISIINATLNGNVVRLSTSPHTYGLYQVTVNNVTDVAGNLISSQNNSYDYEYSNLINSLIKLPVVGAYARQWYLDYTPTKTIDGIGGESRWGGAVAMPDTINFSLGDIQILNTTRISFYNWTGGRIYNYSLQISTDSISWNEIRTNIPSLSQEWCTEEVGPIEARYIRIILLSNNQSVYAGIYEAEFLGHLKIPANNEDEKFIPLEFSLEQNYPNPFNPSTKISWQTSTGSYNTLKVYDVLGNEISTLVDEFKPAGSYEVEFNTSSTAGELTSGVYFYRLQTTPSAGSGQAFTETKKMVLLR